MRFRPLLMLPIIAALALCPAAGAARRGVVPDRPSYRQHPRSSPLAHTATLPYNGGSVMHWNRTHPVFWLPAGSGLTFDPGYVAQIETFLAGVAHDSHLPTNVYSLTGQYYDETGRALYQSSYGGAILDTDPRPPRDPLCQEPPAPPVNDGPGWSDCVTDNQIQAEVTQVAAAHHLPSDLEDIYLLITPNGLGDCDTSSIPATCALGGSANNGYCGYHASTTEDLLYAVIPYNALPDHCQSDAPRPNGSTADPTISTISHEHNETITDPLGGGWIDGSSNEDGDLCLDQGQNPPRPVGGSGDRAYDQVIANGHYWLQLEWSNESGSCQAHDEADSLSIKPVRSSSAGALLRLKASGSDPDGRIVAYQWTFGDRSSAHGSSVRHSFARPGRYQVTVRSTDVVGNWAFAHQQITVTAARARERRPRSRRRR